MIKRMVKVFINGLVETTTKEDLRMILDMDTERCTGQVNLHTRVNGKMEYRMDKELWYMVMEF